jgi:hypothetical protein
LSEGGEKPKSVTRIDNIKQSHLCLKEGKNHKEPKDNSQYQTKPPMSEGGEQPKSLNRIDNIRQSHLCLREEKNQRA